MSLIGRGEDGTGLEVIPWPEPDKEEIVFHSIASVARGGLLLVALTSCMIRAARNVRIASNPQFRIPEVFLSKLADTA